jgi:hypothetical protein
MFLLFRVVGNQIQEMLGDPLMIDLKKSAASLEAKVGSSLFILALKKLCEKIFKKQVCRSDPGLGFFAETGSERPNIDNIFDYIFSPFI